MSTVGIQKVRATEMAVKQLRAYAKYLDEHAENIIADIDSPHYVTDSGIRISFTLLEREQVPTLTVTKDYIVLDAIGGNCGCNR